ncbi:MAG: amidohydrolase [Nocardioidaceae bacterium]
MKPTEEELARLTEIYQDLHRHPELSLQETRTAGVVAGFLRELDIEVLDQFGVTGVVGIHRNGAGPTVYLRADMDALPVAEETGLDYASTVPGVMHACGHDMHVTCLLGAAQQLRACEAHWRGTVVYLFQPAEETGEGALAMLADPRMADLPKPAAVLGQHVGPLPSGHVLLRPGPTMAASDSLRITMHGVGGHGSQPESTIDPVYIAASTVVRLQSIVSREIAPATPVVVTVGSLHAGTKENIIPATATLEVNIRTFSPESRQHVLSAVERIARAEAAASDAPKPPDIETIGSFPVTVNDAALAERLTAAFETALGGERVGVIEPVNGSEDFMRFGAHFEVPSVFWFFGGTTPPADQASTPAAKLPVSRDQASNHSPHFAPLVHPTLETGVLALVTAARQVLDSAATDVGPG